MVETTTRTSNPPLDGSNHASSTGSTSLPLTTTRTTLTTTILPTSVTNVCTCFIQLKENDLDENGSLNYTEYVSFLLSFESVIITTTSNSTKNHTTTNTATNHNHNNHSMTTLKNTSNNNNITNIQVQQEQPPLVHQPFDVPYDQMFLEMACFCKICIVTATTTTACSNLDDDAMNI